jgi:hypothetical protein
MKTILWNCQQCNKPHALVWLQRKRGPRQLCVICDAEPVTRLNKAHDLVTIDHQVFIPVTLPTDHGLDLEGIPEFLTPQAKKEAALKQQNQLVMTHTDGPVERGIPETPEQASLKTLALGVCPDGDRIILLQRQIDDKLRAVGFLEDDARRIDREIRTLRGEAHTMGAELSKLQTDTLKFTLPPK